MKKRIISIALILVVLVIAGLLAGKALTGKQVNVSWYNDEETEFIIETADQLYELVELSEKKDLTGKTFKLGADIVVNEGNADDWSENAPKRKWYPIKNFSGTFDGQGHTISGLYANIYDKAMGLFVETQKGAIIKDFRLVNTYFKIIGSPGSAAIAGGVQNIGTFEKIYTDAIIDCDGNLTGGIVSSINGESTISECWFDGSIIRYYYNHTGGGIVAQVNTTTLKMDHCLNSGTIVADKAKDWIRIGGLCGLVAGGGKLHVTDSLVSGTIDSVTTKQVGSTVGFVGSSSTGSFDTVFATTETYGVSVGNGEERIQGGAIRLDSKNITGYNGYSWTNLDFDKYWAVDAEGTPILKYFAEEEVSLDGVTKNYNTDWYTGKSAEYTINTKEELYGFSLLASSKDFTGVTVKLGADIAINEGDAKKWEKEAPANFWIPIMNWTGIFDGQGHTISGVYIDGKGTMGLFYKTMMDSIVKNFRLTNSFINNSSTSTAYTGSIAGIGGGEFNTIYSDAIMTSTGVGVGGIVGSASVGKPQIINCWFDGNITLKGEQAFTAAGMVASVTISTSIEHCLNTGNISANRTENYNRLGGMAGVIGTSSTLAIKDSLNTGIITAGKVVKGKNTQAGSLIGFIGSSSGATLDTVCMTLDSFNVAIGQNEDRCVGMPIQYAREDLLGIKGYQWTNLDFAKYWAAVTDKTPELKSFAKSQISTKGVARKFDISWYSADKKSFVISDAADLYGVAMLTSAGETFKGKTIKIENDIIVNAGDASTWATNTPEDSWIPIANFLGTFDGQGHTVSGLYKNGGTNIALFANAKEETVIKNVAVENSYLANKTSTGNVYIAGLVAQGGGTIDTVYSDVIIETTGVGVGGIFACANVKGLKIKNAWFAGEINLLGEEAHSAAGIAAIVQQDITLETCLFSGKISAERTTGYTRCGGFFGVVGNKSSSKVADSLSVGEIKSAKSQAGSVIGFLAANVNLADDVYVANEVYSTQIGQNRGELKGSLNKVGIGSLKGEKAKTNASGLDFDKYWMTLSQRTPILKSFELKAPELVQRGMAADISWYNKTDKTFVLTTAEQLHGLSELSYDTEFEGVTIKLGADITVNTGNASDWKNMAPKYAWDPIQTFSGTFDGQGHTISGLYIDNGLNAGLFAQTTEKSVVKNLKLTNSYFTNLESNGVVNIGGIAGQGGGRFDTIYTDVIISTQGQVIGGIIACVNTVSAKNKIINCWFAGELFLEGKEAHTAGGIVGEAGVATSGTPGTPGTVSIENCLIDAGLGVDGKRKVQITSSGRAYNEKGDEVHLRIGGLCAIVSKEGSKVTSAYNMVLGRIVAPHTNQVGSVMGYRTGDGAERFDVSCCKGNDRNTYILKDSWERVLGNPKLMAVNDTSISSESKLYGLKALDTANNLDYTTYWAPIVDGTPVLRSFIEDRQEAKKEELSPSNYDITWYNKNDTEFYIENEKQLLGLAVVSKDDNFKDKTIYITKDIELNTLKEGETIKDWLTTAPETEWTPIGSENAFAGTLTGEYPANSGNIHSISGLYVGSGKNIGFFAKTTEDSVIKNIKLLNSCFVNYDTKEVANIGSIIGQGGGTIDTVYSDAIVATTGNTIGGLIGSVNIVSAKNAVTNCWFAGEVILNGSDAHTAGGIVGEVGEVASTSTAGSLVIKNCLVDNRSDAPQVTSTVRTNWLRLGGIVGMVFRAGTTVTLEDNMVLGTFSTKSNSNIGSIVGRNGETLNYGADTYVLKSVYKNVSGNPGVAANVTNSIADVATLIGWEATKTASQLDFDVYWAPIKDSTPVLRSFIGELEEAEKPVGPETPPVTPEEPEQPSEPKEITEYNTTDKVFTIKNVEQLYKFVELSQTNSFEGQTIRLLNDIIVNRLDKGQTAADWAKNAPSKKWTPICPSADYTFKGIFDGQGYTISGLYALGTNLNNFGLFGRLDGGTIQNVRLTDTYFGINKTSIGNVFSGSIVGSGCGTIKNVYSNAIISSDKANGLGGIMGTARMYTDAKPVVIENCWFDGSLTMTNGGYQGGGILGMSYSDKLPASVTITNCLNTAAITQTGTHTSYKYDRIGGIVGLASGAITFNITDCLNVGTVSGDTSQYGAIIGMIGSSSNVVLTDVYAMTESCSKYYGTNGNSGITITPNFVAKADLEGELAKTNASGLDYESVWVTSTGNTPILSVFSDVTQTVQATLMRFLGNAVAVVAGLFD